MQLERQVCSLGLAKRLKELGVTQDSCFWWLHYPTVGKWELLESVMNAPRGSEFWVSAFTVAELLGIVPHLLHSEQLTEHKTHQLCLEKQASRYRVMYVCADCMGKLAHIDAPYAADALAEMAVRLVENHLWDPTKPLPFRAI